MAGLNTYLNFKGNTEEAFNFYKSVFGGEFQVFSRFKDMPPTDGQEMPENITSHGSKQKNREFFCHICDKNFVKEKKTDSLAEQVPTTNLHLQHL